MEALVVDWLRRFFAAFVPAAVKQWWADWRARKADADLGAAAQRAADDASIDQIAREAEGRAHDLHQATDEDVARRLDRWRRP